MIRWTKEEGIRNQRYVGLLLLVVGLYAVEAVLLSPHTHNSGSITILIVGVVLTLLGTYLFYDSLKKQ